MTSKFASLQIAVDYIKPDVIIGCESKLNENILTSEVFPENYRKNTFRKDRNVNGGGVFLSFRDEFVVEPLPNLENDTEAIWAKVLLPGEKALYVGSFYRPPKSGSEPLEKLEGVLESIIDKPDNKHLILGGDFNCPSIDWQNLSVRPGGTEPAAQHKLLDIHKKFAFS